MKQENVFLVVQPRIYDTSTAKVKWNRLNFVFNIDKMHVTIFFKCEKNKTN